MFLFLLFVFILISGRPVTVWMIVGSKDMLIILLEIFQPDKHEIIDLLRGFSFPAGIMRQDFNFEPVLVQEQIDLHVAGIVELLQVAFPLSLEMAQGAVPHFMT